MKKVDIIKRGIRNLRRNMSRTILTVMAISVGAFTLVLTLGVGNALENFIDTNVSESTTILEISRVVDQEEVAEDNVITAPAFDPSAPDTESVEVRGEIAEVAPSTLDDAEAIKAAEGVADVWPDYSIEASYLKESASSQPYVISSVRVFDYTEIDVVAGSFPTEWAIDEVVVGEVFAATFGTQPSELIGTTILVGLNDASGEIVEREFTVVGVAEEGASFGPPEETATGAITIGIATAESFYDLQNQGTIDYGNHTTLLATIDDAAEETDVTAAIEAIDPQYQVSSISDIVSILDTIVNFITIALVGFSGIALIAAAFGIINTQLMSVFERTKEIGLLKALGMSNKAVQRLFSYEAIAIGAIGAGLGSLTAFILQLVVNTVFSSALEDFGGAAIRISITDTALVILGLSLLAWLAGVIPARKAQNLDPIVALRND